MKKLHKILLLLTKKKKKIVELLYCIRISREKVSGKELKKKNDQEQEERYPVIQMIALM